MCLSAKCEEDDDLCGSKNGSPCGAPAECRSDICHPPDGLCGLPNGEPCTTNGQCRSELCKEGVCAGSCDDDDDCNLGQVCEASTKACVPGCRPGTGLVDGGQAQGRCPPREECVAAGGDIGQCQPRADAGYGGGDGGASSAAGDFAGIVEGGGCSCNTTISSAASPFAIMGAACGALLLTRRRQRNVRRSTHRGS